MSDMIQMFTCLFQCLVQSSPDKYFVRACQHNADTMMIKEGIKSHALAELKDEEKSRNHSGLEEVFFTSL